MQVLLWDTVASETVNIIEQYCTNEEKSELLHCAAMMRIATKPLLWSATWALGNRNGWSILGYRNIEKNVARPDSPLYPVLEGTPFEHEMVIYSRELGLVRTRPYTLSLFPEEAKDEKPMCPCIREGRFSGLGEASRSCYGPSHTQPSGIDGDMLAKPILAAKSHRACSNCNISFTSLYRARFCDSVLHTCGGQRACRSSASHWCRSDPYYACVDYFPGLGQCAADYCEACYTRQKEEIDRGHTLVRLEPVECKQSRYCEGNLIPRRPVETPSKTTAAASWYGFMESLGLKALQQIRVEPSIDPAAIRWFVDCNPTSKTYLRVVKIKMSEGGVINGDWEAGGTLESLQNTLQRQVYNYHCFDLD